MSDTMETEEPSPAKQREVIRGTQDLDKLIKSKLEKATEENPVRAAILDIHIPIPIVLVPRWGWLGFC